jgi:4-amino-4-deoxy-L-arabinose transferase-like glycosyltransferase
MRAIPALSISMPGRRIGTLRVSATAIWLAGLTLLALALRLFWVFYTDTIPLGGDPHWYYIVGVNLAKGYGYVASRGELNEIVGPGQPTAYWPPGYPFAIAAAFKLFGASVTHAQSLNALLGACTVPFIYALGAAIFDRRAGLAAASLYAVFPNAIVWLPVLFPEPLFVLLFVAAAWLLVVPPPAQRTWLPVVGFGLLVGMAALTRGEGLVLLPIATIYWLARLGARTALPYTAIALVAATATIAPWTVRNAVRMHTFIPISTNSASVLRMGHAPDSTGFTQWTHDEVGGVPMADSHFRPDWEVAGYHAYTRLAIKYALTHPTREIGLSKLKIYNVYRSDAGMMSWLTTLGVTPLQPAGLEDELWYVLTYSYYVLLFAAIASVPIWLRLDARRLLLAAVFLCWTLFHVIFVGDVRYHIPMFPFFAIAVAGGASLAIDHARAALARLRPRSPGEHVRSGAPTRREEHDILSRFSRRPHRLGD